MIITIAGTPGSGKGTLAKRLGATLGVRVYSIGDLRRATAAQRGLTLEEFNRLGESDASTDHAVDEYTAQLGKTQDNFIVDGRVAHHFIPQAIKLFVQCDLDIAAHRILEAMKQGERKSENDGHLTPEHLRKQIGIRMASDAVRFKKYYGIEDVYDPANFDFAVDTTHLTPDQTFHTVWGYLQQRGVKLKGQD